MLRGARPLQALTMEIALQAAVCSNNIHVLDTHATHAQMAVTTQLPARWLVTAGGLLV